MIKTWQQRCEEHPDHDGIVSDGMIQARMQEEINELRAAIEQAQPEQELVCVCGAIWEGQELVSAPSQRQWPGLTDEEIRAAYGDDLKYRDGDYMRYARTIEAKLKEKNT